MLEMELLLRLAGDKVMSNTFFTSDTHYFHRNICAYSGRPFSSVEDMNEALVNNYNSVVKKNDTVYFLGDFSFSNLTDTIGILERLNGTKHFICGNHDKVIINNHKALYGHSRFSSFNDYKEIYVNDQKICLFHFAQRIWNKAHHGSWHLFGHSHGSLEPNGRSVDVGVDSHWVNGKKYFPFEFEQIAAFMKNQKFEKIDHHEE